MYKVYTVEAVCALFFRWWIIEQFSWYEKASTTQSTREKTAPTHRHTTEEEKNVANILSQQISKTKNQKFQCSLFIIKRFSILVYYSWWWQWEKKKNQEKKKVETLSRRCRKSIGSYKRLYTHEMAAKIEYCEMKGKNLDHINTHARPHARTHTYRSYDARDKLNMYFALCSTIWDYVFCIFVRLLFNSIHTLWIYLVDVKKWYDFSKDMKQRCDMFWIKERGKFVQ